LGKEGNGTFLFLVWKTVRTVRPLMKNRIRVRRYEGRENKTKEY